MRSLRLPDRRRITFEEFGDSSGLPTFFFHGTPSSSRIGKLLDRAARERHLRLIALNRPGIAGSTFQRGRTLADWPADVASAADRLSIERFYVCGHSGGAPYALACASMIGGRVAAVAILGGALPQELAARAALSRNARSTLRQFDRPRYRRFVIAACGWAASVVAPRRLVEHSARGLPPPDLEFLRCPGVTEVFAQDLRAALRGGGRGAAHDHWLVGQPSGLDLETISCPVSTWYGGADRTAHPEFGRVLQDAVSGSELRILPGAGHLSLFTAFGEIATWLAGSAQIA